VDEGEQGLIEQDVNSDDLTRLMLGRFLVEPASVRV
jgi:hypothetical protein